MTVRHGLAAWVADELWQASKPVPAVIQEAARVQVVQSSKVKRLTLSVLDALSEVGVVPVLLKGYGLASRLFPSQPLARPTTDVDVLVSPADLLVTEKALERLGLRLQPIAGVADVFTEHHHRPWAGLPGLVEVHFRLFTGFGGAAFDDAGVLARSRQGVLDGRSVRWLCPEDEFLYLATHAANHGFLRLSWLVDLAAYVEAEPDLNWELMHQRAQAAGFMVPVSSALFLLERVLRVPLPPGAHSLFGGSAIRRQIERFIFSPARVSDARWSDHWLFGFLLRLYLVDSAGQGARHLLEGARRALRRLRGS